MMEILQHIHSNEDSSSSGEVAHLASGGPQLGDKDRARAERKGH